MAAIRNSSLIKRFTDFFKLKTGDMLDGEVTPLIVPTINFPIPPNIQEIIDVAANDSDKTITVPSGKQWKILSIYVTLATTATVGDRNIRIDFRDAGNDLILEIQPVAVQAANLSFRYVYFPAIARVGVNSNIIQYIPIPNLILPGGFDLRVFDSAVVDAAADDMTIRMIVEETDLTGE